MFKKKPRSKKLFKFRNPKNISPLAVNHLIKKLCWVPLSCMNFLYQSSRSLSSLWKGSTDQERRLFLPHVSLGSIISTSESSPELSFLSSFLSSLWTPYEETLGTVRKGAISGAPLLANEGRPREELEEDGPNEGRDPEELEDGPSKAPGPGKALEELEELEELEDEEARSGKALEELEDEEAGPGKALEELEELEDEEAGSGKALEELEELENEEARSGKALEELEDEEARPGKARGELEELENDEPPCTSARRNPRNNKS